MFWQHSLGWQVGCLVVCFGSTAWAGRWGAWLCVLAAQSGLAGGVPGCVLGVLVGRWCYAGGGELGGVAGSTAWVWLSGGWCAGWGGEREAG